MTSRPFNQDTSGAKKAAEHGPIYLTDRGGLAHVLLTFDAYQDLIGQHRVLDLVGWPAGRRRGRPVHGSCGRGPGSTG